MSSIRKQLAQARADYRAQEYPGNLAHDLLPPRKITRYPSIFISALSGAALAACLILAFQPSIPTPTNVAIQTPIKPTLTTQPAVAAQTTTQSETIDFTLVPESMDLSVPSWDAFQEQANQSTETTATSRESV